MFEKTKTFLRLYQESVPKGKSQRRLFVVSQLLLFTAVPGMTLFQWLGDYWTIVPLVYLTILLTVSFFYTNKLNREVWRQEEATRVAERLREEQS